MKVWINKTQYDHLPTDYSDAYIFTLNRDDYSTIYTNIADTWHRLGALSIQPIYEDLFIIAISVFAMDKRISRALFKDCWTRTIEASIPVIEIEKWKPTEHLWNEMLSFLTGDSWNIFFRESDHQYSVRTRHCLSRLKIDITSCDVVSLFSGGLDSFCGAISLLENKKSPCLFGHNEYPKLSAKQESLVSMFRDEYKEQSARFLSFTANSRAPMNFEGKLAGAENTSRGRSLLFLCGALTIASIMGESVPVYIPENGFIGLNIPLTDSRKGSCSTRTTHPFFIRCFKNILTSVGIDNPILNNYAFTTKRNLVKKVKHISAFQKGYDKTISCSHPCNPRYNKTGSREYPINCGYCYPCLIRKSSLLDVEETPEGYSHNSVNYDFINKNAGSDKTNDLSAVFSSLYRYKDIEDSEIRRLIKSTGQLDADTIEKFLHVYKETMNDLIEMFSKDSKTKERLEL